MQKDPCRPALVCRHCPPSLRERGEGGLFLALADAPELNTCGGGLEEGGSDVTPQKQRLGTRPFTRCPAPGRPSARGPIPPLPVRSHACQTRKLKTLQEQFSSPGGCRSSCQPGPLLPHACPPPPPRIWPRRHAPGCLSQEMVTHHFPWKINAQSLGGETVIKPRLPDRLATPFGLPRRHI